MGEEPRRVLLRIYGAILQVGLFVLLDYFFVFQPPSVTDGAFLVKLQFHHVVQTCSTPFFFFTP